MSFFRVSGWRSKLFWPLAPRDLAAWGHDNWLRDLLERVCLRIKDPQRLFLRAALPLRIVRVMAKPFTKHFPLLRDLYSPLLASRALLCQQMPADLVLFHTIIR